MINKNPSFDVITPSLQINKLIGHFNKNFNKKNKSTLKQNLRFQNLIIQTKKKLKKNKLGILLRFGHKKKLSPSTIINISESIIELLGKEVVQDNKGNKLVFVLIQEADTTKLEKGVVYIQIM